MNFELTFLPLSLSLTNQSRQVLLFFAPKERSNHHTEEMKKRWTLFKNKTIKDRLKKDIKDEPTRASEMWCAGENPSCHLFCVCFVMFMVLDLRKKVHLKFWLGRFWCVWIFIKKLIIKNSKCDFQMITNWMMNTFTGFHDLSKKRETGSVFVCFEDF